jgi:hypothetical protein
MKRKDFIKPNVLPLMPADQLIASAMPLSLISTHTLNRWLRKAKYTQMTGQWAVSENFAKDIIRVLEKKK